MNIISANGHAEAFQMVETGRAVAFVMDDILLYSLVAQSRSPKRLRDLRRGAVGRALRHHGAQGRRGVQEGGRRRDQRSSTSRAQINAIYDKWFLKPVPPKNINLNVPMSAQFKKVVANPTDSGDPNAYK